MNSFSVNFRIRKRKQASWFSLCGLEDENEALSRKTRYFRIFKVKMSAVRCVRVCAWMGVSVYILFKNAFIHAEQSRRIEMKSREPIQTSGCSDTKSLYCGSELQHARPPPHSRILHLSAGTVLSKEASGEEDCDWDKNLHFL